MPERSTAFILLAITGALFFLFSGLLGFGLWYCGFVICLWFCLALLNYPFHTSLWMLQKRPLHFIYLFSILFIFGFIGDFFIGIRLAQGWTYPHYNDAFDWIRLYAIVYPLGGLSVMELLIFLGSFTHERLKIARKRTSNLHRSIDYGNMIADLLFIFFLVSGVLLHIFHLNFPRFGELFVFILLFWVGMGLAQLVFHLLHGLHWLLIFALSIVMLLSLHELPNLSSHEWVYRKSPFINQSLPFLNTTFAQIPYWVFVGWVMILLLVFKCWTGLYLVYFRERQNQSQKVRRR